MMPQVVAPWSTLPVAPQPWLPRDLKAMATNSTTAGRRLKWAMLTKFSSVAHVFEGRLVVDTPCSVSEAESVLFAEWLAASVVAQLCLARGRPIIRASRPILGAPPLPFTETCSSQVGSRRTSRTTQAEQHNAHTHRNAHTQCNVRDLLVCQVLSRLSNDHLSVIHLSIYHLSIHIFIYPSICLL